MALAQTERAAAELRAADPEARVEVVRFQPRGDRDQLSKLHKHGGKGGAFVSEIREAMHERTLHAAMHSLKDMPGDEETPGLVIGAYLEREPAEDVLVLRHDYSGDTVSKDRMAGLKIGTNSVRRSAYLQRLYPKADVVHYRGAADTRIRKLDERVMQQLPDGSEVGPADALVVAKSGLSRLGLESRISHEFSIDEMLPAVGQGIVAIECLGEDWETRKALAAIDNPAARACAEAEREILWVLNGHCNSPIAAHAGLKDNTISLCASVISLDGKKIIESSLQGPVARPREIGRTLGLELLEKGAKELIDISRVQP